MATAFMGLEAVPSGRFNPMTGAWELFDELPESKVVRPANMVEAVEAMRGQPGKIAPEMGKAMLENAARARTQTMLNPNLAANAMVPNAMPQQAPQVPPQAAARAPFWRLPQPGAGLSAALPPDAGLRAGLRSVASGTGRVARPALGAAGALAVPAVEAIDAAPVFMDPESTTLDKLAAASKGVGRGGATLAGAGIGQAIIPVPFLGAALGGAAGFLGGDKLIEWGRDRLGVDTPPIPKAVDGGATTAPPGRQAVQGVPPPAYLMRQPEMPAAGRVVPQGALGPTVAAPQRIASIGATTAPTGAAPAESAATVVPAQTIAPQPAEMPQSTIDDAIKQYRSEIGRIDQAFEEYKNQTGMVAPKELTPADKWSILARGLGVAALVAAFPGAGLLMGLGAGGLAGSSAFDQARRQKELDAQAARDQLGKQFDQRRQIEKDRMGALGELLTTAVKRDEGMQDRNAAQSRLEQELAARREAAAMEAALRREGFQNAARIAGISAAARQQPGERGASRGVTYNIPEAIRNRAEFILLNTPGMTAPEAISMARMQVQSDIPLSLGGGADPDLERYGQ